MGVNLHPGQRFMRTFGDRQREYKQDPCDGNKAILDRDATAENNRVKRPYPYSHTYKNDEIVGSHLIFAVIGAGVGAGLAHISGYNLAVGAVAGAGTGAMTPLINATKDYLEAAWHSYR